MKITTIIIAIVLLMVGWMAGQAGAASELLGCTGEGCQETAKRYLARHSCVKQWEIFDRRREQGSEWASISPNCPRPEKPEPKYIGAEYTLTSPPTIAKGSLDRKYKLKPECRWEVKFIEFSGDMVLRDGWEPVTMYKQVGYIGFLLIKRQVCEEAK